MNFFKDLMVRWTLCEIRYEISKRKEEDVTNKTIVDKLTYGFLNVLKKVNKQH